MISFLTTALLAVSLPFTTEALDAYFKGNCDNVGTLSRSDDGGLTFSTLVAESGWGSWGVTLSQTLTNVDSNTVVSAACRDVGYVGAFIAQVVVGSVTYPTLNPLSSSMWTVDSTDPLTYDANGVGPWYAASSSLDSGASWVWNTDTWNTMTFELDFADVLEEEDLCGDWGVTNNHSCQCQSECTGDYCNTDWFVAQRLGVSDPAQLCSDADAGTCCCSCPNCQEQGYNFITL